MPTGNFGDVYAGYVAERMGLPIDRLVIATNVNDILARTLATGAYELRDVVATTSPSMDIQVSSNFERLSVRRLWPRRRRDPRADGFARAVAAASRLSAPALAYIRALFSADRADEDEVAATIRAVKRETGNFVDPHTAVGIAVAEKETRDPAVPMVVLSTAHAAKFPDAVEAACGARPALPEWLSDLEQPPGARHGAAGRSVRGRAFRPRDEPRRARRSGSMSVEVTTLKSGISVVTDAMPHLESASLGVWVASGSRDERRDEHGISHFLEHMAFKGTRRRTARQIAEEIEAVGGDLNAATGAESTAYYARVLKADVPLALDVLADILSEPAFERDELMREQNVIVQEIGAVADTPGRSDFRAFEGDGVSRAAARPLDSRHAENRALVRRRRLRDYLARNYRAPDIVVAAAGAVEHQAVLAEVEKRFGSFNGPAGPVPEPARFGGGTHVEKRELEQVHIALALPGVSITDPSLYSLQVFTNVLGGGMSSRLFQEARERRGLCYSIYSFHVPYSDIGMFGLYAGTDAADTSELMRLIVDEIAGTAATISEPKLPAPRRR